MYFYHHTYSSPINNLAIDEFLLKEVEKGSYEEGLCRIWESDQYFVVLGLSKKVADDVYFNRCQVDDIQVLRRCTGGGTVLQGPGCFNYSYILPINLSDELKTIQSTTTYILSMVQQKLNPIVRNTKQQGISDLVIDNVKFSGNAQRRLKKSILFHGTILYNFDLSKIDYYLKEPPIQPSYRQKRKHTQFIQNIQATSTDLIQVFLTDTNARLITNEITIPSDLIQKYQQNNVIL